RSIERPEFDHFFCAVSAKDKKASMNFTWSPRSRIGGKALNLFCDLNQGTISDDILGCGPPLLVVDSFFHAAGGIVNDGQSDALVLGGGNRRCAWPQRNQSSQNHARWNEFHIQSQSASYARPWQHGYQ